MPIAGGTPTRGGTRMIRVAGLGGGSLLLGCSAHLAGGEQLPGAGLLATVAVLLGLQAVALTRRRRRFGSLLVLLGAQQLLLHVLFSTGSHHSQLADLAQCLLNVEGLTDAVAAAGLQMWLGHGVAVLATAWLLARGESWLWEAAARAIRQATASPSALPLPYVLTGVTVLDGLPGRALNTLAAPRGPPLSFEL